VIGPATAVLASSAACIATTSSWWVAVKRLHVTSQQECAAPVLQTTTAGPLPPATLHRGVEEAVIASGIFRKTHLHTVSAWLKHLRPVRFPAGHIMFAQGDPAGPLYMIASGKVKVVYRHTDGREAVLNVLGPSEVFGEVTPFDFGPREVTVTAVTEVCAVAVERRQLLVWMAEFPEVMHQIMRLLARRADLMTKTLTDLACPDPTYRVANRLLMLGRRFGRKEGDVVRVVHDLTLEEISLFASVPPETVAATLRSFEDRDWIRADDGCLLIMDSQGLADVSARLPEVNCG
jgi:CRP/FNR family cyclic AMP-dependent transcriptional regulator